MSARPPLRPRLSLPFTIVPRGESLHLIAGEDVRYTLHLGPMVEIFAPLLNRCDGTRTLEQLLGTVSDEQRPACADLLARLAGERVLIEGPLEAALPPGPRQIIARGSGPLCSRLDDRSVGLRPVPATVDAPPCTGQRPMQPSALAVFCQDTLDIHAALQFNRERLRQREPWLWVSTGALQRGFVGPVFLPDAGPCLACLLGHFERLSPVPQLHAAIRDHGESGGAFAPATWPDEALAILEHLVRWKADQLERAPVPAVVFRLHVLERETMEVTAHRLLADPTCRECSDARAA